MVEPDAVTLAATIHDQRMFGKDVEAQHEVTAVRTGFGDGHVQVQRRVGFQRSFGLGGLVPDPAQVLVRHEPGARTFLAMISGQAILEFSWDQGGGLADGTVHGFPRL